MYSKRYVSVICEYNPFHFGHKLQMDRLKKEFDGVVCIMSGNVVQRGSVAVADKYLRAEAALNNGADLVLELPIPWCCSSARDFARAGVHIADAIGVNSLAFGAEDDDKLLFEIHALIENGDFQNKVKAFVEESKSVSYPQAVTELVGRALGKSAAEAVKKPNNILSLEYLSALGDTRITPFIIKRESGYKSSSEIRSAKDGSKMLDLLPAESRKVFERELGVMFPRDINKLDPFFVGNLRRLGMAGFHSDDIYSTPDDLIQKILLSAVKCSTVDDIVKSCTDKNYTSARIRRSINAVVFGITHSQVHNMPTYTSALALNGVGREILRNIKKNSEIDIINKPVRALDRRIETKNAFLFAKGVEDIISLSDPIPEPADAGKNPTIRE